MKKSKPTIGELEKILEEEEVVIQIMPDGSVKVADGEAQKLLPPKIFSLEEVLKRSTY